MTDWMEIDARLTALEAQVDTLRRQQGLDELVQQGQAMGAYETEPTNFEAHDCPHWQPEQEHRSNDMKITGAGQAEVKSSDIVKSPEAARAYAKLKEWKDSRAGDDLLAEAVELLKWYYNQDLHTGHCVPMLCERQTKVKAVLNRADAYFKEGT